jgi:uncharacterized membrane protein
MAPLRAVPAVLAFLVLGAHCFRNGWIPLAALCLAAPVLLFLGRRWAQAAARSLLVIGAAEWVRTLVLIAMRRQAEGAPWTRMAAILGAVALLTLGSALLLRPRPPNRGGDR